MDLDTGSTPLVLLCPAWKRWGRVKVAKPSTVILHSEADDVIPFAESRDLVQVSGLPESALVVVGNRNGQVGCGYESQLESWYRFLVDPTPYDTITLDANKKVVLNGTDKVLLDQRKSFLRPDSLLAIIMLTDENDCSIRESGQFYFAAQQKGGSGTFHLPKARAIVTNLASHELQTCGSLEAANAAASSSAAAAEGTGRGRLLPNIPTFEPSCLVTNSSSSIASSGVCIGMTAAGVMRSLKSRK